MNKEIQEKEYGIVLYTHPYPKSYSSAMRDAAVRGLETKGLEVVVYDLTKMKYDPIGDVNPTPQFTKELKQYQEMFKGAKDIVIVYPTWWSSVPAHMEIFLDNVFAKNIFFKSENGIAKCLPNKIKNVYIFSTSFTPNWISTLMLMNPNKHRMLAMFKTIGAKKVFFKNLERVSGKRKRRIKFLRKIETTIRGGK